MTLTLLDVVLGLTLVTLVVLYVVQNRQTTSKRHLPPGPRPLPILGNAHQMPSDFAEKVFAQWKDLYGDVIFLRMFNTPVLVLNSAKAARDLLEKRSTKYSDRPYSIRFIELLGWDASFGLRNYGEMFRRHRRWLQAPFFDKASIAQYLPVQTREAHVLLSNLLVDPDSFVKHVRRFSGATMLETLYGHSVISSDDEYLRLIDTTIEGTTAASAPGAALVDFIPILKYTPTWLPGGGWKRRTLEGRAALQETHVKTYALAEMHANNGKLSVVGSLIKEYSDKGEIGPLLPEIMQLGTSAYSAGTDTTKCVLQSFILAMVLHPEVYKQAQDEMDRVVGHDRLPTLEDRDSLPYLECIQKETYRWLCPVPLSLPHASSEDDEYRGYFIPKGTTVIPNLWICPGRRFADISVWLGMSYMIATLDISKARDALGNEITPPGSYEPGLTSCPVHFECSIKARSQQAAELIASTA
ncbi:hypothetical protein EVJ58_g6245 [Rhodofomes roseus]|uniref:Cytochrome P450 n=1 Tax=Rhodofomes roseus TaxID=34475 RepID=A0A4Y9Y865_9APHY|nr:hypothetical protein EVJ58_g6245 [Rhodofomes roseus]